MAATIETNLQEMVEIDGNARRLVQRVRKESTATAGNSRTHSCKSGFGQPVEFAAAKSNPSGSNGNGGNGHVGNGSGHGRANDNGGSWVNRLKQFAGVVEQEI